MAAVAPYLESSLPPTAAGESTRPFVLDPGLSRFASVLLAYVIGLTALATLTPFDFDLRHPHGFNWQTTTTDIALNLAFLFPVGFLLRLSRPGRGWPYCLDALCFGLCLSIGLELTQAFLPTRVTSPTDMLTNGCGAWAGGCVHAQLGRFLDRRLQKQLSLHLPLANLLYLSAPLLSLDALAARDRYDMLPALPLALFMASLAAGLYKHRLEGNGQPFTYAYSGAIGLLFGVGWLPMAARDGALWLASVLSMAVLTRIVIAVGTRLPTTERRFVPATIQRALPFLFGYLLLLGARVQLSAWLGLPGGSSDAELGGQSIALGLLRDVAAFTLLGYVCSELRARSSLHAGLVLLNAFAVAAATAFGLVLLQRSGRWSMLAIVRCGVLAGSALAGAAIHRAQLKLVRSWARPKPF
jgi:glycopeptide antibiotics resistance protein